MRAFALFWLVVLCSSAQADGPVFRDDCTITWDAGVGGPPPDGYHVLSGPTSGIYPNQTDVGLVTTVRCSEAGLSKAGQKYVVVRAYDAFGVSEVTPVFPFTLTALAAPSNLMIGP
jgi:hypothetical protein